ncbi:MAG: YfcE family phosphodiesterase [Fuerstiella sp.]|nr:YfcE family phosphodiesterase [Fuerstiella sp.]
MRILLLADIHSNWPALAAIDEEFDACFFLGDLVDYATDPVPCVQWIQSHATRWIRGNHDHSLAQRVIVRPSGTFRRISAAMRPHHFRVMSDEQLTWLARMPVTEHATVGGHRYLLVHASPRDPLDEYVGESAEQWKLRLAHIDVDFVCVGHTHIPMQLDIDGMQVINPGSVGQPRDGDPRAAYATIDDGKVEFHRVAYNIDQTVEHMRMSEIDPKIIKQTELVLRNGGTPPNT